MSQLALICTFVEIKRSNVMNDIILGEKTENEVISKGHFGQESLIPPPLRPAPLPSFFATKFWLDFAPEVYRLMRNRAIMSEKA